jgi:LmbE family N-acetylglucosaminyl deacetylase
VFTNVKPDIVYTHFSEDVNQDHRVIFNSVLVCSRPIQNLISVRCFETVSSTEWGRSTFAPNFYVPLSEEQVQNKIKAFACYESEVKKYPHPRSKQGVKNLAMKRGNEICKNFAECFILHREYWNET